MVAQETAQSSRATPGEMSRAASTRAAEFGSDDRRSEERKSSRTGKGRSGFMAIKTEPLSPTVPLVLEEVDIFQHEDVFGVLDDGANSSVCGKKWCDNAEKKLAGIGFEFPWLSKNGVSFKGLGGSTKTLGDRRLVFCVECRDSSPNAEQNRPLLPGILDCRVTSGEDTPLLLSLYAQSTLGLLKDLKNFVCIVQRSNGGQWEMPLVRTKGSNLLAVNLSAGLRGLARVRRPLKPYRTMLPRLKNKVHKDTSLCEEESHEVSKVEDVHVGCKHGRVAAAAMSKHITVVSAGVKWSDETSRYLERPSEARACTMAAALVGRDMDSCGILVVDCLKYSDPEAHDAKNSWLKQHIGQRPALLEQTWNGNPGYRDSIFYNSCSVRTTGPSYCARVPELDRGVPCTAAVRVPVANVSVIQQAVTRFIAIAEEYVNWSGDIYQPSGCFAFKLEPAASKSRPTPKSSSARLDPISKRPARVTGSSAPAVPGQRIPAAPRPGAQAPRPTQAVTDLTQNDPAPPAPSSSSRPSAMESALLSQVEALTKEVASLKTSMRQQKSRSRSRSR